MTKDGALLVIFESFYLEVSEVMVIIVSSFVPIFFFEATFLLRW